MDELRALLALTVLQLMLQCHTDLGKNKLLPAANKVLQLQDVDINIDIAAAHVMLYKHNGLRITFGQHVAYIQVTA